MTVLIDIFIVFVAVVAADYFVLWFREYHDRKLNIGCDYCEEPKRTKWTPDKDYKLCNTCLDLYVEKHKKTLKTKLQPSRKRKQS